MIVDSLDNKNLYKGLSKDIYLGLEYLESVNSNVELGVHGISKNIKAIVENYKTQNNKDIEFESHKNVIDIQYPIIGLERIFWTIIDNKMEIKIPYDNQLDRAMYSNSLKKHSYVDIGNKIFAIMFKNDGHSPKHCVELPLSIKKITIKVSIA